MAQVSFRVDDDVKRLAEQVCEDIGMSMSTAINIYLKKIGRDRCIPFELSADPFYSDRNMSILRERINDMNQGINISEHELIEVL